jgi:hypothetical protein
VETARAADGRWIAEVPELPGMMAYGSTEQLKPLRFAPSPTASKSRKNPREHSFPLKITQ